MTPPGAAQKDLLERFRALDYPQAGLSPSRTHLELAWTLLAERPLLEAMGRFRRLLQAFAAHHGAHGLYDETVTCFYLLLIRERMDGLGTDHDWPAFRSANLDLFTSSKAFLDRWYPAGGAFSADGKTAFMPPLSQAHN